MWNLELARPSELNRMPNRLTHELWEDAPWNWAAPAFPALNVWEDQEHLYAEAEVPGLKLEKLEVYVQGGELTIKGERKSAGSEGAVYHRQERGLGAFARVLRLPMEVKAEEVKAALKNGVLTITLPKGEAAKPRKIEVQVR